MAAPNVGSWIRTGLWAHLRVAALHSGPDDRSCADARRDTDNRKWSLDRLETHAPAVHLADGSSTAPRQPGKRMPIVCDG
jgi:hypothetical protein